MKTPTVSVVMSVYNGAEYLHESIESILSQGDVDFEFIIVNDGSTDESPSILEEYANKDKRIKPIYQKNQGLTKALIKGCSMAKGEYIARQDADDISLPGRLWKQLEFLKANKKVTVVSCWTAFVGPEGEELNSVQRNDSPEEATRKLRCSDINQIQGVSHHGSTMFKRIDYNSAGGYRRQFYFAQDLDLWLRLTDDGLLGFVPELLYRSRITPSCISAIHHNDQLHLTNIMLDMIRKREDRGNEAALLKQAESIKPEKKRTQLRDKAKGLYFIGKCLLDRKDRRGMKYMLRSIAANPLMLKSWLFLLYGILNSFEKTVKRQWLA